MKEGGGVGGNGGDEASASVGWTKPSAGLVGAGLRLTAAAVPATSQQPADSAPNICIDAYADLQLLCSIDSTSEAIAKSKPV